jgi:hypothetical protein
VNLAPIHDPTFADQLLDYVVSRVIDGRMSVPDSIRIALCDRLLLRAAGRRTRPNVWDRWAGFCEQVEPNKGIGSFRDLLDEQYSR